jgi:hypothetical protein
VKSGAQPYCWADQAPFVFKILMSTVMRSIFDDKNNQEQLFLGPVGGRCALTPPDPQLKGAWYPGGFNSFNPLK